MAALIVKSKAKSKGMGTAPVPIPEAPKERKPRGSSTKGPKVKLRVAENVTLRRGNRIYRPGDVVETERDDEVVQWLKLEYAAEVKTRKTIEKRKK